MDIQLQQQNIYYMTQRNHYLRKKKILYLIVIPLFFFYKLRFHHHNISFINKIFMKIFGTLNHFECLDTCKYLTFKFSLLMSLMCYTFYYHFSFHIKFFASNVGNQFQINGSYDFVF